jgi:hypothetical protein
LLLQARFKLGPCGLQRLGKEKKKQKNNNNQTFKRHRKCQDCSLRIKLKKRKFESFKMPIQSSNLK